MNMNKQYHLFQMLGIETHDNEGNFRGAEAIISDAKGVERNTGMQINERELTKTMLAILRSDNMEELVRVKLELEVLQESYKGAMQEVDILRGDLRRMSDILTRAQNELAKKNCEECIK